MRNLLSLSLAALVSTLGAFGQGSALDGMETAIEIQREQIERMRTMMSDRMDVVNQRLAAPPSTVNFSNPKAKQFFVDGTKIPDVNFDAGPSWSGLLPISGAANETRKLFFWFWPTNNPANTKDLVFWTNGMHYSSALYF
jgi:carboxypeptidase D